MQPPVLHFNFSDVDFLRLRTQGFEAYAENRYSEAAGLFTKAIDNFWLRRMVNTMCIEQCVKDRSLVSVSILLHVSLYCTDGIFLHCI